MLLRSSSTPSVQPCSESPSRDFDTHTHSSKYPQTQDHFASKLSFNFRSLSCNSSPISSSASRFSDFNRKPRYLRHRAFRKCQSDGNLEGLGSTSFDPEEFKNHLNFSASHFNKKMDSMLYSAPSFCIYTSSDGELESESGRGDLERSDTIGDTIEELGSGEFNFGKKCMDLIEENDDEGEVLNNKFQNLGIEGEVQPPSPRMYLATGLGIDSNGIDGVGLGGRNGGGSGGGEFTPPGFGEGGNVEMYYKRMVDEDPSNPLFLRNYAKLLESKGDLPGAEENYFRATLADPKDGEILMLYAKLVWELHHDRDRALNYFEQAAQAAPHDNHVLAAYACFLWEIEEDQEEESAEPNHSLIEDNQGLAGPQKSVFVEDKEQISPSLCLATKLGMSSKDCETAVAGQGGNIEEYYKRMIEENPSNPLLLRNYAQFLYKSKRDVEAAEEYYSRAIIADPMDGEIISEYAKLVWEIHHDQDKAMLYFERAVQATPENSHVLAAYASFLWETEEDENEDGSGQGHSETPLILAATIANA
ncbi:hypothetical protein NMG60_11017554 [Bertholletia excelsa]